MPATDSPVVARMRAAGAVILGKTNVPVLSHTGSHANDSWAGPTYNAAGREFLPGGSSAGTATAVAASLAVLGLAEETGGSIQNPASAQALVGIKPTFALVPNAGVMPLSGQSRRGGADRPLRARRGADARRAGRLHRGGPEDRRRRRPAGRRAATRRSSSPTRCGASGSGSTVRAGATCRCRTETTALYGRAQRRDSRRWARCWSRIRSPAPASRSCASRRCRRTNSMRAGSSPCLTTCSKYLERMGPDAALQDFAEFAAATAERGCVRPRRRARLHARCCRSSPPASPTRRGRPTCRSSSPRGRPIWRSSTRCSRSSAWTRWCSRRCATRWRRCTGTDTIHETTVSEINIAGLPGVTVPAGYYASGAPFGSDLRGPQWSEADLLGYAYAYERATRHRKAPSTRLRDTAATMRGARNRVISRPGRNDVARSCGYEAGSGAASSGPAPACETVDIRQRAGRARPCRAATGGGAGGGRAAPRPPLRCRSASGRAAACRPSARAGRRCRRRAPPRTQRVGGCRTQPA